MGHLFGDLNSDVFDLLQDYFHHLKVTWYIHDLCLCSQSAFSKLSSFPKLHSGSSQGWARRSPVNDKIPQWSFPGIPRKAPRIGNQAVRTAVCVPTQAVYHVLSLRRAGLGRADGAPCAPPPSAKAACTSFSESSLYSRATTLALAPGVVLWFDDLDIFVPNTQKIKGRKCAVPLPMLGVAGPHRATLTGSPRDPRGTHRVRSPQAQAWAGTAHAGHCLA